MKKDSNLESPILPVPKCKERGRDIKEGELICQMTCNSLTYPEDLICFDPSEEIAAEICVCEEEYYWTFDNTCVTAEDCLFSEFTNLHPEISCNKNEVVTNSDMICHHRCPTQNGIDSVSCENNFERLQYCMCADGYVLDDNDNCILKKDCPKISEQEETEIPLNSKHQS